MDDTAHLYKWHTLKVYDDILTYRADTRHMQIGHDDSGHGCAVNILNAEQFIKSITCLGDFPDTRSVSIMSNGCVMVIPAQCPMN